MRSPRGNPVPNQFIVTGVKGVYFQSYATTIALMPFGVGHVDKTGKVLDEHKIQLDEDDWACSTTTGKYRNIFLGETKKETQKKIDSGEYILTNLN